MSRTFVLQKPFSRLCRCVLPCVIDPALEGRYHFSQGQSCVENQTTHCCAYSASLQRKLDSIVLKRLIHFSLQNVPCSNINPTDCDIRWMSFSSYSLQISIVHNWWSLVFFQHPNWWGKACWTNAFGTIFARAVALHWFFASAPCSLELKNLHHPGWKGKHKPCS